jgi:hypothetical protein
MSDPAAQQIVATRAGMAKYDISDIANGCCNDRRSGDL